MSEFSACFLLVFGQLAVGGLAALAVPPFALLERGFYKSSAGVFVGCAVVYLSGTLDRGLHLRSSAKSTEVFRSHRARPTEKKGSSQHVTSSSE